MEFDQIVAKATEFFQAHLLISVVALIVVAYFFYQSPKESFKVLVFLAILAVAGYFVLQLSSSTDTGVSTKEELANKTKKALGE